MAHVGMVLINKEHNKAVVSICGDSIPKSVKSGDIIKIKNEPITILEIGRSRGSFEHVKKNLDILVKETHIKIGDEVQFM